MNLGVKENKLNIKQLNNYYRIEFREMCLFFSSDINLKQSGFHVMSHIANWNYSNYAILGDSLSAAAYDKLVTRPNDLASKFFLNTF